MAGAGLSVVVFLLGVMVGRGVSVVDMVTGHGSASASGEEPVVVDERPAMVRTGGREPSVAATDGTELSYYERLDGDSGPGLDAGFLAARAPGPVAEAVDVDAAGAAPAGSTVSPPARGSADTRSTSRRCARASPPNAWRRGSSTRATRRSSSRRRQVRPYRCSGFASGPMRTVRRPSESCSGSKRKSRSSPGSRARNLRRRRCRGLGRSGWAEIGATGDDCRASLHFAGATSPCPLCRLPPSRACSCF